MRQRLLLLNILMIFPVGKRADIRASFTCERSGDYLRGGDQYADVSEDQEEAHERCEGEEQGCACDVGGAEKV